MGDILLVFCVCVWLSGCETPKDCATGELNHAVVAFYEGTSADALEFAPAFDSVVVLGKAGLRRRFLYEADRTRLDLPVDLSATHTDYVFYKANKKQQLTLHHEVVLFRPAEACGVRQRTQLTALETEDFASAAVVASVLSADHSIHVALTP